MARTFENLCRFVGGAFESQSLQRYVVNRSLEVKLDGEIGLAKYSRCTPVFFSSSKAFCIAPDDGLLIEFDPIAMEINRSNAPRRLALDRTGQAQRLTRYQPVVEVVAPPVISMLCVMPSITLIMY
jgi:hypothetical protein